MTQVRRDVPSAEADLATGIPIAPLTEPSGGWLALADASEPIDLARLFPDVEVRVRPGPAAFEEALAQREPSLVILIAPPAGPGEVQRVAGWLAAHRRTSAVLLSPHHAVALRLHALELGFDDAVDLSSDLMEVVGRLSIAGRRTPWPGLVPGNRVPIGPGVDLDFRARAIRRDGHLLSLRPREMALLEFLVTHPGRAFSREELVAGAWQGLAGNDRMVDVYVFWLRAKIERDPANPVHLVTVRGAGYLFDEPTDARPRPERAG